MNRSRRCLCEIDVRSITSLGGSIITTCRAPPSCFYPLIPFPIFIHSQYDLYSHSSVISTTVSQHSGGYLRRLEDNEQLTPFYDEVVRGTGTGTGTVNKQSSQSQRQHQHRNNGKKTKREPEGNRPGTRVSQRSRRNVK